MHIYFTCAKNIKIDNCFQYQGRDYDIFRALIWKMDNAAKNPPPFLADNFNFKEDCGQYCIREFYFLFPHPCHPRCR